MGIASSNLTGLNVDGGPFTLQSALLTASACCAPTFVGVIRVSGREALLSSLVREPCLSLADCRLDLTDAKSWLWAVGLSCALEGGLESDFVR